MSTHKKTSASSLQQEKDFHNRLFDKDYETNERNVTGKYYAATQASKDEYNRRIQQYSKGKKVLEYGCGPEGTVFFAVECGAHYGVGIDISEKAVEKSTQKAQSQNKQHCMEFRVMNAETLEFEPQSFDLVFGAGIIHHLDVQTAYAEISRVLQPSGSAIFLEPLGHNPIINLYRKLTPNLRTPDEHPLIMDDIQTAHQHFSSVQVQYYSLWTLAVVPFRSSRLFPTLLALAEGMDKLTFSLPFLRRYAWVIVMTLSQPR